MTKLVSRIQRLETMVMIAKSARIVERAEPPDIERLAAILAALEQAMGAGELYRWLREHGIDLTTVPDEAAEGQVYP